jgi:hypothetical protein
LNKYICKYCGGRILNVAIELDREALRCERCGANPNAESSFHVTVVTPLQTRKKRVKKVTRYIR